MTKIEVLSVPRFMFCLPICTCSAVPRLPVLTASLAFSRGWGTAVWTLALRTIVGGGGD